MKWRHRPLGTSLLLLSISLLAASAFSACTEASASNDIESAADVSAPYCGEPLGMAQLRETYGLELVRATVSAGGGMIDLRYQVLVPDKAEPILTAMSQRFIIIDEETGLTAGTASVAKIGELNQRPHESGTAFALFGNPGGVIRSGNTILVVAGDTALGRLTVW